MSCNEEFRCGNPLNEFFNSKARNIYIYVARETIADPEEKNVELNYLPPYTIKALITDLTTTQAMWKLQGIHVQRAKELVIASKDFKIILMSHKIVIDGNTYYGWKDNAGKNIQYRNEGDYYRVLVYSK
ncbi:MAG: hypothetical protein JW924_03330 [Fusobacteriaceae bacterium]|nr:hypothetical protein [Fusobacteriaceae bacterium]